MSNYSKKTSSGLNKIGRIGRERIERRQRWIAENPSNHEGAWVCYICQQWVYEGDMELDHVEPKSSTSAEVSDSDENLRPTHKWCNQEKGSTRVKLPKLKRNRWHEW